MKQKELADLLGVSAAMVSRHAKQGMPTDDLERAKKWRKRHLEPSRVKGSRYEPGKAIAVERPKTSTQTRRPQSVSTEEIESAGGLVDAALARSNIYGAAIRTWSLRRLMRSCLYDDSYRLSLRVWLSLLAHVLHEEAEVRNYPDMARLLTATEFGECGFPDSPWPGHVVLFDAFDWDDDAINGYPEYDDDEG